MMAAIIERNAKKAAEQALKSISELPDLDPGPIKLKWDVVDEPRDENQSSIRSTS
jgi:hypothetical protein